MIPSAEVEEEPKERSARGHEEGEEGRQASLRGESRDRRSPVRGPSVKKERKKPVQKRGNDEKSDGRLERRLAG